MTAAPPGRLRGELGLADVVAQAASGVGPIYSAIVFVPLVTVGASGFGAGGAVPLCILVAAVLLMAVARVFAGFARQVRTPGSLYDYLKLSLGRRAGTVFGLLFYACAIAAFVNGTLTFGGLAARLAEHLTGHALPWWLAALGGLAVVALSVSRGITLAVHLQLAVSVVSIGAVGLFAAWVLVRSPHLFAVARTGLVPSAQSHGLAGVMMGLSFAFFMYGGFEGAASLAEECRNPTRAIPRAMILTIWVNGAFYLLTAFAALAGFGADAERLGGQDMPLLALAVDPRYGGPAIEAILMAMTIADVLAMITAGSIAIARGLLCLARDGVLPAAFARTSAGRGVPVLPNLVLLGGTAVLVVVIRAAAGAAAGQDAYRGWFIWIGTFASLNLLIAWCATCIGGFVMGRRGGGDRGTRVCAATGTVATLAVIAVTLGLLEGTTRLVPLASALLALAGWWAMRPARS
ncbi:amino acid permease [Gluconacetobacter sacchari DSM 12717]|uniref:APC family permease n=2 Tax=Gluconacetobacter sacchari TaxID=92759 RepID=A0A7W4IAF1_9PROT|nr:APC family permease [Gluconacetobacter sacchari]MBB2159228.1 APC family permease [Gluconacetobacter sacchari]GBQ22105.1 amino acid permease [Gluconacetobacter sacchari DSM 12717]